jgi:hypothetical protein
MIRPALALLTALAALGQAPLALAQPSADSAQAGSSADALFTEGSALLKAGKTDEACQKLAESQRIEPAIGTLGLLAYCHEQSGKLATALREYGETAELARLAGQTPREKVARERMDELSQRVTRLSIQLSQPADEVVVTLNARRLEASELGVAAPIDAGSAELRIAGRGFEPWSQTLTIPADGSTLRVVAPRLQQHQAAPPVVASPAPVADKPSPMRRNAMWSSFAVGGLGVALGSYLGISAISARSDSKPHCQGNTCDQIGVDARDRALDRARWSTVGFTVAAIGAGAGVALLLTDHSPAEQTARLSASPGGAHLSWERRF